MGEFPTTLYIVKDGENGFLAYESARELTCHEGEKVGVYRWENGEIREIKVSVDLK